MTVYTPRGILEAVLAALQRWALQLFIKPVFSPRWPISFQRRWLTFMARISLPVPRSVTITPGQLGGVAGEWLRRRPTTPPQSAQDPDLRLGTLLYLHGGAYCIGSPAPCVRLVVASKKYSFRSSDNHETKIYRSL